MRDFIDLVKIDHKFSSDMLTIESAMKVADIMIFESYTTGGDYEVLTENSVKEILGKILKAFMDFLRSIRDWFKKMWAKLTGKKKDADEEIKEFKETYIEGKKGPLLLPAPQGGGSTSSDDDGGSDPEAPKMIEFKGDVIEKAKPDPKKHKGIIIKTRLVIGAKNQLDYYIKDLESSLSTVDELIEFLKSGKKRFKKMDEDQLAEKLEKLSTVRGADSTQSGAREVNEGTSGLGLGLGMRAEPDEVEITNSTSMVHTAKMYILAYDKDVDRTSKLYSRIESYIEKVDNAAKQAQGKLDKIVDPEVTSTLKKVISGLKKYVMWMSATAARLHSLVIERALVSKSFLLAYIKEIGIRAGYDPSKRMPKLENSSFEDLFFNIL